ncbi:MAG: IS1 family transposase [Anaerolineae bacterium]|nr:IS1 family transposase [Anaerolineae bacterium]
MIRQVITYRCTHCHSDQIVKNGHNPQGKQQYRCKACGRGGVLNPTVRYSEQQKEQILATYRERPSLRGIERIYGVARQTVARWLKKALTLPPLESTLLPAQADDVLELDEMWSFVGKKERSRWTWTVLCRRTRQIVAFVIGDRSEATCRQLWEQIPTAYRGCHSYSDFWAAYSKVFPATTHHSVDKASGATNHMERWNNTLRQRCARYVRQTLSFSKSDVYHALVTLIFIVTYNLDISLAM